MRTNENIVSSFFYYMWNTWCKEECEAIQWTCGADHIWSKWSQECRYGVRGAAERFYAELSDANRIALVKRATTLYNGRSKVCRS